MNAFVYYISMVMAGINEILLIADGLMSNKISHYTLFLTIEIGIGILLMILAQQQVQK